VQRVPLDTRWRAQGLESIDVPCQQLYDKKAARGVQVEGFADDPNAQKHEQGKVRAQRVWIYEEDYKTFGITDDCKKCLHNQRWGYNASIMMHSEKCRTRMEQGLATTEEGRERLAAAEERINQKLAKQVEESDARPERGIGAEAGPDVKFESDFVAEPVRGALAQREYENPTPAPYVAAADRSTQGGARRPAAGKLQGPRGLSGASTGHSIAVERTSIDDWIDEDEDEMDLENGNQVPQSPQPDDDYEPTTPRGSDSEVEMDMGMVGLLKTCGGNHEAKELVTRDAEEILKLVRDLGGSVSTYKRERNKAMKGIVSEIYSPPRITKTIKMMPSSEVLAGFALDHTTCDTDLRA
jgi:hypothetical protein